MRATQPLPTQASPPTARCPAWCQEQEGTAPGTLWGNLLSIPIGAQQRSEGRPQCLLEGLWLSPPHLLPVGSAEHALGITSFINSCPLGRPRPRDGA